MATKPLPSGKTQLNRRKIYRVAGFWDENLKQRQLNAWDQLDFSRKTDAVKYAKKVGIPYGARRVSVVLYEFDKSGNIIHREDAYTVDLPGRQAPKEYVSKPKPKPQLRKNRYSVRCHSYQGGYLMFEGSLTRTAAERLYKECKADGYTPAIFDGRKKVK